MLPSFFNLGSFTYTSRAGFVFIWEVSPTHPMLTYVGNFMWVVFLTHPALPSILWGELLLHIACWIHYVCIMFLWQIPCRLFFFFFFFKKGSFSYTSHAGFFVYHGSFSYTSRAGFVFISEVSVTHPVLASFFFGSFSYTSRAGYNFIRGLTYPMLSSFDISRAGLIIMAGVSLTHPMLTLFLCGEFVLDILCCLHFYAGSFSYTSRAGFHIFLFFYFYFLNLGNFYYTSRAGFIFIWEVSLTHPVLASFLSGKFLLHIPCWLHFYLGSFSYTSHAGFIFKQEVSLTHPMLASFLSREFLLHILCWLCFSVGSVS